MLPADGGDKVLNDIVFFIKCDETGERVVDCCEYVDPFASQQIKERISAKAWRESAAGQTLGNGVNGTNGTDSLHRGDGEGIPPDGAAS